MNASLIITTYNWPEALAVTLRSVLAQSVPPQEIIIADDGSGPETARVVVESLRQANVCWRHVRHEDNGIRQARIKNLGVRYSESPYLIFIDHDVALHPDFIADHLACAKRGVFLQGKRAFLPEGYTRQLIENGRLRFPSPFSPGIENRKNALRFPSLGRVLSRKKGFQTVLRGCNLSMYREAFLAVDGYDETFDGLWGREDSDICYRLFHTGVRIRNLWFQGLQYHLYHKVIKRGEKDRLDEELERIRLENRKKAIKGFSQLSPKGEIVASS